MTRATAWDVTAMQVEIARLRSRLPKGQRSRFEPFLPYARDLPGFMREVLHLESATRRSTGAPYQDAILADLAESDVCFCKARGCGGTVGQGVAELGFLLSHPLSLVLVLCPQHDRQLVGIHFTTLRALVRRADPPLPVRVFEDRVEVQGYGRRWCIQGLSASADPAQLEGFHAADVLLSLDEAKAIERPAFDALLGGLTGAHVRILVSSTPGASSGLHYDLVTDPPPGWKVHRIAATDSSLVRPDFAVKAAEWWGRDSAMYAMQVRGEHAADLEGQLLPTGDLDQAFRNGPEAWERVQVERAQKPVAVTIGVDTARSLRGDESVAAVVVGGVLADLVAWRSNDVLVSAQKVADLVLRHRPTRVRTDVGGPGAGLVDALRRFKFPGVAIEGVAFGGASDEPDRFLNRRAQMYWQVREALAAGALTFRQADEKLRGDLLAQRYELLERGVLKMEPKEKATARLGRSPDRADALCLALDPAKVVQRRGASGFFRLIDGAIVSWDPVLDRPVGALNMGDPQDPDSPWRVDPPPIYSTQGVLLKPRAG